MGVIRRFEMCSVWKRANTWPCSWWLWSFITWKEIQLEARLYTLTVYLAVYCDIDTFPCPTIITREEYRPDIVIKNNNTIVLLELTAGYETNIEKNGIRKQIHYRPLIDKLKIEYDIKFINLSMGAIGIIGEHAKSIKSIFSDVGVEKTEINFIINRIINVCIRTTYYIFCKRNQQWDSPELLSW